MRSHTQSVAIEPNSEKNHWMYFLQAIESDLSVLIVCNKTGGTIKGDITKNFFIFSSGKGRMAGCIVQFNFLPATSPLICRPTAFFTRYSTAFVLGKAFYLSKRSIKIINRNAVCLWYFILHSPWLAFFMFRLIPNREHTVSLIDARRLNAYLAETGVWLTHSHHGCRSLTPKMLHKVSDLVTRQ